jgi:hypothetical protein
MVSSGGEQFRRVAERRGKARRGQRGRVSGGRGVGAARGARKDGAVAADAQHMAGEGGGASGRETEEERGWR